MSIRLMSVVWDLDLPDSDKLVLLALADNANDEGACWPSVATISKKCSKSEKTVIRSIRALKEAGHLSITERSGKSNIWHVHPKSGIPPVMVTPGHDDGNTPPHGDTRPPPTVTPKPLLKHQNESSSARATRLPKDFSMPVDWLAWAMKDRKWDRRSVSEESASFIDYWHGVPGSRGTKLDWPATWRNWCRNSRRKVGSSSEAICV